MKLSTLAALLLAGAPLVAWAQAREVDVRIDARANLFAAGRAVVPNLPGGGGVLPVWVRLDGCRVVTVVAANGRTSCMDAQPALGPEGGHCLGDGSTDIDAFMGISGLRHAQRQLFVAGVFLGDREPVEPAPPILDCTTWSGAADVAPGLAQAFYLGDGVATGGVPQRVKVPEGATRLFLGFVDGMSFHGAPGYYDDNRGEVGLRIGLHGTAPEPAPQAAALPVEPPVMPKVPPPAPVELNAAQKSAFRQFLKRLKGVPSAYVEERPALHKDRLVLVVADWKRLAPSIVPVLTAEEKDVLLKLLAGTVADHGLKSAGFAVDAYGLLAGKLPETWERNVRWADRDVLDAWICAEEGEWAEIPNLAATFVEVLKLGDEKHLKLVPLIRENLQKTLEAVKARDKARTKIQCALLRRLLEELDIT